MREDREAGVGVGGDEDALADDEEVGGVGLGDEACLLYTSPSPRDVEESRMPSSA